MTYFPEEVVQHVFNFLTSHRDRNVVSLVCKSWYEWERLNRHRVFVGNCNAISPDKLIARFPKIRALRLKGMPDASDLGQCPREWGGYVHPWIEAMAKSYPGLEELSLKRMVISDEDLELLSCSFPNFQSLVLVRCEGFTSDGLATIATNCRPLRVLDLQETEVEDLSGEWLSCFPDSCTSLESLNFSCLEGEVDLGALEKLVARCPNLKCLKLNDTVPFETLYKIFLSAPQLVDLGTRSYFNDLNKENYRMLENAVLNCQSIRGLSGFFGVAPHYLPAVYPICLNLTSLNLSYAPDVRGSELINLIYHCQKLQRLWILDSIGDIGLEVIASTCKELQELRVFPCDPHGSRNEAVTEEGLIAISRGCRKLHSLLCQCFQMTNAGLIKVAKNCPNLTRFELSINKSTKPDHSVLQPLDEGFGAIVQSCKGLRRLSLSGLLTDQVFLYIGMYGKQLETLSIVSSGDFDKGMLHVLNGCKNLKKLAFECGVPKLLLDTARLAQEMPRLNVEIFDELKEPVSNESQMVTHVYVYRTFEWNQPGVMHQIV